MKRLVSSTAVVSWVLAAMSAFVAASALAQTEGGQYLEAQPGGSAGAIVRGPGDPPVPDLQDYVLNKDGIVVVDGDTGMDCRTFALSMPGADASSDMAQAQSVLEQCEQRGLLPSDDQYATNMPAARGQQPPVTQAELLPATGGPGLSMAVGAALAGAGLLVVLTVLGIVARRCTTS